MALLRHWLDGSRVFDARVLVGPPGAGKTRLALEFCIAAEDDGWTVGFWDQPNHRRHSFPEKLLIVIEKTRTGFSACSPDLPGCVATGATRRRVESAMKKAIEFHLAGMRAEGMRVPAPSSYSTYVEVPA